MSTFIEKLIQKLKTKKNEQQIDEFEERIRKLQESKEVEIIRIVLHKPVLYLKDADEVIKENAHCIWTQNYQSRPNEKRLVKYQEAYYWVIEYYYLSALVKLGEQSELLLMRNEDARQKVEAVADGDLEVPICDCSSDTGENTVLVAKMNYIAVFNQFSPKALILKGTEIRDFPHSYWEVQTIESDDPDPSFCCGHVFWKDEKRMFGDEIVRIDRVSLWTGQKILRLYTKDDYGYSIERMLDYWEAFLCECDD